MLIDSLLPEIWKVWEKEPSTKIAEIGANAEFRVLLPFETV